MKKLLQRTLAAVSFAGLVACATEGCYEGGTLAYYSCADPHPGHLDAQGQPDPCCKNGPCPDANGQLQCDGDCLPLGPSPDWLPDPVLLWHGSSFGPIPDCPAHATAPGRAIGRDPLLPATCPLCECSAPACVLPQGLIADGTAACGMPGPFTPFPPEDDGSCSNRASFEPNQIQSFAILPPTVTPCVGRPVEVPVPRDIKLSNWNTTAIVCTGQGSGMCGDRHNRICSPHAPDGFMQCVKNATRGVRDAECPPGYPNKHVYYEKVDYQIACSRCKCSPPLGSVCTAEVTAYKSTACTVASTIVDAFVSLSPGPLLCVTVQANTALKGLTEAWLVNEPGTCTAGQSVPTGAVQALESSAWEYCCADPDIPDVPDPGPNP